MYNLNLKESKLSTQNAARSLKRWREGLGLTNLIFNHCSNTDVRIKAVTFEHVERLFSVYHFAHQTPDKCSFLLHRALFL